LVSPLISVSKIEQKEIKLEIGLPEGGFPKTMNFNRFRMDREAGFCLVQFGLVVTSDLLDSYSCVLSEDVLKQNEKTLVEYLNRIGRPAEGNATPWKGASATRQTDVADVITMAFRGNVAETCLYVFSLSAATRAKRGTPTETTVMAQPLVLLRSTAELQKQLIAALYEE
jgi:hypothetical protein